MGKSHKNENNPCISLDQIYLPKFHENILKYYKLDLFKEIAIGFNHMTSESPASLSDSLFRFVHSAVILAFGSYLVLCVVLLVSHLTMPNP